MVLIKVEYDTNDSFDYNQLSTDYLNVIRYEYFIEYSNLIYFEP